jgi:hypothetical protein
LQSAVEKKLGSILKKIFQVPFGGVHREPGKTLLALVSEIYFAIVKTGFEPSVFLLA